jgi:hypothetical protein
MRERVAQGASVRHDAARESGRPVLHECLSLGDAHPLDRHGHDDAGQARLRLPHHQRVHATPGPGQLRGELGQPRGDAGGRGIAAKLGAERRVDQEPLDQPVLRIG